MNEHSDLNQHHRRRLLVSCQYVDSLLSNMESVMAGASLSPFPRYIADLSPEEIDFVRERIATLRAQMVSFLRQRKIPLPDPTISAHHSILTSLGYIDIALEELKPRYLGGYGQVPQNIVPALASEVEQLQAIVKQAVATLKQTAAHGAPEATAS
jgi:hypothetical protein